MPAPLQQPRSTGEPAAEGLQSGALDAPTADSVRARTLYRLAWAARASSPDSAIVLSRHAAGLFRSAGLTAEALEALEVEGEAYLNKGDLDSSLAVFELVHLQRIARGDTAKAAAALMDIAAVYERRGDLPGALEHYLESARLEAGRTDGVDLAVTYHLIGLVFQKTGELNRAMGYFERALEVARKAGSPQETAAALISIGLVHRDRNEFEMALARLREAGTHQGPEKPVTAQANWFTGMGGVFAASGQVDSALAYYRRALDAPGLDDPSVHFAAELGMAEAFLMSGNIGAALRHAETARPFVETAHNTAGLRDLHRLLSRLYEASGQYDRALQSHRLYKAFDDSLKGSEQRSALNRVTSYFEFEQEKDVMSAIRGARLEALEHEVARLQRLIVVGMALLLAAVYISMYVMNRSAEKRRINALLEQGNREIKTQKEALERQKLLLDEMNRLKDRLLTVISSDLRGPLSKMSSVIVMIRNGMLTEAETEHVLNELESMAESNMRLLDNLLVWARRQWRGAAVERAMFTCRPAIDDALADLQHDIAQKQIALALDVADDAVIYADRAMICVVLYNLISNAVKFSANGGRVYIAASMHEGQTTLSVSDEGRGISKDKVAKIFTAESFAIPDADKEPGAGLGLIICRDFVAANGGGIDVESAPGWGTKFTVKLPCQREEEIRIFETTDLAN